MWKRSPRSMPVYVHVKPPTRPSSPVDVHVRPYGGHVFSSFGVSCVSAQPSLFTTAFAGVLGHLSLQSLTPSPSVSTVHAPASVEPSVLTSEPPPPSVGLPPASGETVSPVAQLSATATAS